MFIQYRPGRSLYHRLDVRSKAAWLVVVTVLLFVLAHPSSLALILAANIITGLAVGLPFRRLHSLAGPLLIPFLFMLIYESFFHHGDTVILALGSHRYTQVTAEGLARGLVFVLRLMNMVVASTILTLTTSLYDIAALLRKMRVPAPFTFVLTTGFTFFPTFEREAQVIFSAQKSRGRELDRGVGLLGKVRLFVPIFVPLLMSALRRSETLARAMLSRAYGADRPATTLYEIRMVGRDYAFLAVNALVLIGGIILARLGYGQLDMWR